MTARRAFVLVLLLLPVVGNPPAAHVPARDADPWAVVSLARAREFGVLFLGLRPRAYMWEFVP